MATQPFPPSAAPAGFPSGGLRAVAAFEAAKGVVILLAGFGLLALVHRDLQAFAAECIARLHLNPARHIAHIFVEAANAVTDARLRLLAAGAAAYAACRLVEAYGLWRARRWAQWFAVASAAIYLPVELVEIFRGFTVIKLAALLINGAILVYLAHTLRRQRHFPL